jgi:hypothetical protein
LTSHVVSYSATPPKKLVPPCINKDGFSVFGGENYVDLKRGQRLGHKDLSKIDFFPQKTYGGVKDLSLVRTVRRAEVPTTPLTAPSGLGGLFIGALYPALRAGLGEAALQAAKTPRPVALNRRTPWWKKTQALGMVCDRWFLAVNHRPSGTSPEVA